VTVPKVWEAAARREAFEEIALHLNNEVVEAQRAVANEDVDALCEERGTPQDLVDGASAALTLAWVKMRWAGMPETDETVAALEETTIVLADLLLKAWVRGAQGG